MASLTAQQRHDIGRMAECGRIGDNGAHLPRLIFQRPRQQSGGRASEPARATSTSSGMAISMPHGVGGGDERPVRDRHALAGLNPGGDEREMQRGGSVDGGDAVPPAGNLGDAPLELDDKEALPKTPSCRRCSDANTRPPPPEIRLGQRDTLDRAQIRRPGPSRFAGHRVHVMYPLARRTQSPAPCAPATRRRFVSVPPPG